MNAHVLLNSFKELGKRDKMRGLSSILSLFRYEFNTFNKTKARLLDSTYHMTLKLLLNRVMRENAKILPYIRGVITEAGNHYLALPESVSHQWFIDFMHGVISLPDVIW